MVRATLSSQDASTHQILDSYLKQYKRYAPDRIIPKTMSEVKVPKIVCDTTPSQDAHTHQIWDSYLKEYIGDMHQTQRRIDGRHPLYDYYMPPKVPLGAKKLQTNYTRKLKYLPGIDSTSDRHSITILVHNRQMSCTCLVLVIIRGSIIVYWLSLVVPDQRSYVVGIVP